jgi:hypothetical protein
MGPSSDQSWLFGDAARALHTETRPCDGGRVGTAHARTMDARSALPASDKGIGASSPCLRIRELGPLGPDLSPSPPSPVVGTVVAPIQIGAARNGVAFYSPRFELFGNWPPLSGIIFATDGGTRNRRPGERWSRFAVVSAALLARHTFYLGHTRRSAGALRAARQFPLGSRIGVCFVWLLAAHFEKMS